MKISENLPAIGVTTFLILGLGLAIYRFDASPANAVIVSVRVPELSTTALAGKKKYDDYCAACHGENGAGTEQGPPLVYDTYNPGHHADQAFFLAAKTGVKSHHWRFGNMPPQPQAKEREIAKIVRYIRELQTANGIFFKKHQM